MVNQYEIAVIYHPDLEVDISKAENKVKKIIISSGGKISSTDNWGKRKLAYQIQHNEYGIYVFYQVELDSADLNKINSNLNITDEVIRFLIIKPDLKAIAKAEALKALKAEQAAKRGDNNEDSDKEKDSSNRN